MKTLILVLSLVIVNCVYADEQSCIEINGCDANLVAEVQGKFRWPGEFINMVNQGKVLPHCRFVCRISQDAKERQLFFDYQRIRDEYGQTSNHLLIIFDPADQAEIEENYPDEVNHE